MFSQLKKRLKQWDSKLRESFGKDISTPEGRRAAILHFHLMDHAYLRVWWTNLAEIAPGVWRSNQPSPKRIARYAKMGIKTIVYLRGPKPQSFLLLEQEACAEHGIELKIAEMAARNPPVRAHMLALLDILETTKKPFLMHCKSGADRAGLASVLYLMHIEGASLDQAREQLSLRFLHLKGSRTGVLDHFLDTFEADTKDAPMPIRQWIETRYDRDALAESFNALRGKKS